MNTTYLCGGINGLSDAECKNWRETAKEILATPTIDPMSRDYRGKEDESVTDIIRGDLRDIQNSNFVLVNASRPSWGTAMEIVYANQMQKYIIAFTGVGVRVSPWLRYHCQEIFISLEDACYFINSQAKLGTMMTPEETEALVTATYHD